MGLKTYNEFALQCDAVNEDGVLVRKVRRPMEGEEVIGYINFSAIIVPQSNLEKHKMED